MGAKSIALKNEFMKYWREGFDAFICPILPMPSIAHGTVDNYNSLNQFNFLGNIMDLPACFMPMYLNEDPTFDSKFKDQLLNIVRKEAETSVGMPVGIQVLGFPMQDEFVLKLVEVISSHYKFEEKYGSTLIEKLN
jgi:Asp-tRNA(Asn)/Glu-tRNA(Gln) amidotransferase A subunit family amidase